MNNRKLNEECYKIIGIEPIKDLSTEELVNEILEVQRVILSNLDLEVLRSQVVHFRATVIHNHLMDGAGLSIQEPQLRLPGHAHGMPQSLSDIMGNSGQYL